MAIERKVEFIIAAVARLSKAAIDIAFARMGRAKTSEGMSHAAGAIPTLNPTTKIASPTMTNQGIFRKNENAMTKSAMVVTENSRSKTQ